MHIKINVWHVIKFGLNRTEAKRTEREMKFGTAKVWMGMKLKIKMRKKLECMEEFICWAFG